MVNLSLHLYLLFVVDLLVIGCLLARVSVLPVRVHHADKVTSEQPNDAHGQPVSGVNLALSFRHARLFVFLEQCSMLFVFLLVSQALTVRGHDDRVVDLVHAKE